jgi:hypothetical protein
MSEYLSWLAPELARGGEKISAKISRKTVGNFGVGRKRWPTEEASSNAIEK